MKTPPFLLGAALLFWGWQSGYPIAGALMAAVLESSRWWKARWEFANEDFTRIWYFCSLLLLGAAVYTFTANEGPAGFASFVQHPNFFTQRTAGTASARAAAGCIRWLPMIFFLFVAAQTFSSREGVPLETVSLILSRQWKRARKLGQPVPPSRTIDISFLYFALCLFAASVHASENASFFWGLSILLVWTLWAERSPRVHFATWAVILLAAIGIGYAGQRGVGQLQQYLGNLNPRLFSASGRRGFDPNESRTMLGQIGRTKASSTIVIRLELKEGRHVPALLREASYRAYVSQSWSAIVSDNEFQEVRAETNETTYVLLPGRISSGAVGIACYLPGGKALLPLPEGTSRLENLGAFFMRTNPLGAVLVEGPGLVVFDAHFGPGPTIDSTPGPMDTGEASDPGSAGFRNPKAQWALDQEHEAVEKVLAELQLKKGACSLDQALRSINEFFESKFAYSLWQEPSRRSQTNTTPLARFLLRTRRGHCEYFATATVLILKHLGFPARYAVGYAVHEASGRNYVVRQRDAHAWCLVWNEQRRKWQDFDTTPASWAAFEAERASPFQFWSDFWSRVGFEFSRFRWGQSHVRKYVLWTLVPVMTLLLYQILFRSRRQRRRPEPPALSAVNPWPGLDSEFYELERTLSQRGLARQATEPLSTWLDRAASDPGLAEALGTLRRLLLLHYRYRFDPEGLSRTERQSLQHEVRLLLTELRKSPTGRAAISVP